MTKRPPQNMRAAIFTIISMVVMFSLVIFSLSSCDSMPSMSDLSMPDLSVGEKALQTIKEEASALLSSPEQTLEEVKKLHQIEYKVVSIPLDQNASEIEQTLNLLGKDRWDCSQFKPLAISNDTEQKIMALCKRPVYTPIRYLTNPLILR